MKKISLLTVMLTVLFSVNAQVVLPDLVKPDSNSYDTLVVFNPFAQYPCWDDDITFTWIDTIYKDEWMEYLVDEDSVQYGMLLHKNDPDTIVASHTINYTWSYKLSKYFTIGDSNYTKRCGPAKGISGFAANWPLYKFGPRELAQPWHLDSSAIICGVYADVIVGSRVAGGMGYGPSFYLRDTNFNIVAEAMQVSMNGATFSDGKKFEYHHFYFYKYDNGICKHVDATAKDFYLTAEIIDSYLNGHTCSFYEPDPQRVKNIKTAGYPYDTIFIGQIAKDADARHTIQATTIKDQDGQLIIDSNISRKCMLAPHEHPENYDDRPYIDTIPLYKSNETPLFFRNKDEGWVKFSDDSATMPYQYIALKILPIILVPKDTTSSLSQPDSVLEANLWVFPNPASSEVKITCGFIMDKIEIFNTSGTKVFEDNTRCNQSKIDISTFDKGVYIVNITTPRGNLSRKFVKQ